MEQLTFIDEKEKNRPTKCVFTGHRELGEDFSPAKLKKTIKALIESGVEVFYNGMAMGFDLLAAEQVLALRKKYPKVKLVACIPYYGQEAYFNVSDKRRYIKVLKKADEQILLSENYYRGCLHQRDRFMVDQADVMVAYCVKDKGGAAYTLSYFRKSKPNCDVYLI
jgi:uncharacterized phage-like protein YoqJ